MHVFDEMQFVSHCNTVVSYQAIFRHSIHKKSAVYLSSARVAFFLFFFLKIREFGSPTNMTYMKWFCSVHVYNTTYV